MPVQPALVAAPEASSHMPPRVECAELFLNRHSVGNKILLSQSGMGHDRKVV